MTNCLTMKDIINEKIKKHKKSINDWKSMKKCFLKKIEKLNDDEFENTIDSLVTLCKGIRYHKNQIESLEELKKEWKNIRIHKGDY